MKIPSTIVTSCERAGCRWQAEIPVEYRLERGEAPESSVGRFVDVTVHVDDAAIEAFDAYLAGHRAEHAIIDAAVREP